MRKREKSLNNNSRKNYADTAQSGRKNVVNALVEHLLSLQLDRAVQATVCS